MKRSVLSILLLLLSWLVAVAQQQLYVCHGDSCDGFSLQHLRVVVFRTDSFRIDRQSAYAFHRVDSIVMDRPALFVEPLGWWGDAVSGELCYLVVLPDSNNTYRYHALYRLSVSGGICVSARCEVRFDEEGQKTDFLTNSTSDANDPYINVKETQTGPRRFEQWAMGNPVVPVECTLLEIDDCLVIWDCAAQLSGRPITEVRLIVETWVHEPAHQMKTPDSHAK